MQQYLASCYPVIALHSMEEPSPGRLRQVERAKLKQPQNVCSIKCKISPPFLSFGLSLPADAAMGDKSIVTSEGC